MDILKISGLYIERCTIFDTPCVCRKIRYDEESKIFSNLACGWMDQIDQTPHACHGQHSPNSPGRERRSVEALSSTGQYAVSYLSIITQSSQILDSPHCNLSQSF
jgi:hypothetical protein